MEDLGEKGMLMCRCRLIWAESAQPCLRLLSRQADNRDAVFISIG
jgi:hypothetical protein